MPRAYGGGSHGPRAWCIDLEHLIDGLRAKPRALLSGDSENWPRCDTKSGPPPRATDQGQCAACGAVTSGAELPGCGVGNPRGCPGDPWPHRSWLGPAADRQGTGLLA
nr:hypothetical protein [Synechococcus sp. CBW1107]